MQEQDGRKWQGVNTQGLLFHIGSHSLVFERQTFSPALERYIKALTTNLGFPSSNEKENKNRKAHPVPGTVIVPAHRDSAATSCKQRCYTLRAGRSLRLANKGPWGPR